MGRLALAYTTVIGAPPGNLKRAVGEVVCGERLLGARPGLDRHLDAVLEG
jgi:hypothetical protein